VQYYLLSAGLLLNTSSIDWEVTQASDSMTEMESAGSYRTNLARDWRWPVWVRSIHLHGNFIERGLHLNVHPPWLGKANPLATAIGFK